MISLLRKTDFPNKTFNNGRLIVNTTESNIEVLIDKINQLIEQVNNIGLGTGPLTIRKKSNYNEMEKNK